MLSILGAALVVGVITVCVGPLYYCKRSTEGREDDDSETSEVDSPLVHIKISHPHRGKFLSDDSFKTCESRRNSRDSSDGKETKRILEDVASLPPEESRIVPVRPPRNRRRAPASIWSSALRNQLENITNSSSEACGGTKVVRAQVEVHPQVSVSESNETPDSLRCESLRRENVNPDRLTLSKSLSDEKVKKLSSVVKKWKNLKKTLTFSRANKSVLFKDFENDETQRLNIPVPAPCQRSPVGHSTMLQKNRLVDASTSTRISSNTVDPKERNNGIVTTHDSSERNNGLPSTESFQSWNDQRHSNAEVLQDVVSLIKRRSVNGKSICDVRISGLTMNQSELLDLFEATGGKTQSASIVTTEEASIISIKFQRDRRRSMNSVTQVHEGSHHACPLKKFYRNLPEKLEDTTFFKLFRPQQSGKCNRVPSVRISDHHSRTSNTSPNE